MSDKFKNLNDFKAPNEIDTSFVISEKSKFIYVTNAKVATTDTKLSLWAYEMGDPSLKNVKKNSDAHKISRDYFNSILDYDDPGTLLNSPDYFTFSIVRNPYSRLLSAYLDKILRPTSPIRKVVLLNLGLDGEDPTIEIPFDVFVKLACSHPPQKTDRHWRLQRNNLFYGAFSYDLIGRLERMDEFADNLALHFGSDILEYFSARALRRTNASDKVSDFYTPALKDKVYKAYQQDFVTFGYDP